LSGRDGHVALVTGAGTGIGAATARLLAKRGMHLALAGRRRELLEETSHAIEALGARALVVAGDLADPAFPHRLVDETVRTLGRLDVLVNNGATIAVGPLDGFTLEQIDRHLAVNTRAPLLLTQEATPALTDSPDGAIVNVSSSVGSIVKPGNGLYGMTKAALEYLTRASAYELAGRRIRVNCVARDPFGRRFTKSGRTTSKPRTPTSRAASHSAEWQSRRRSPSGSGRSSTRRPPGPLAT
jgi:3-oxoacyl-[acyl-carrier protein] reductase